MQVGLICSECHSFIVPDAGAAICAGDFAQCPRCDSVNVFRDDLTLRNASKRERDTFVDLKRRERRQA